LLFGHLRLFDHPANPLHLARLGLLLDQLHALVALDRFVLQLIGRLRLGNVHRATDERPARRNGGQFR
jgi:hypothetical protein